jgi:hypothetical protein
MIRSVGIASFVKGERYKNESCRFIGNLSSPLRTGNLRATAAEIASVLSIEVLV